MDGSKLVVLVHFATYSYASLDPIQTDRDGNKFAFMQDPYINSVKAHKDVAVQKEVSMQWPNGIVKYHVDNQSYDITMDALLIKSAIYIIEQSSCVEFEYLEDIPNDIINWIHITNPGKVRECVHQPQYKDHGEIILVFGYDCFKHNEILHTMLHGIGMKDEVTHPLRDKHIRVLWDNINPAYHHLYRKQEMKSSKTLVEYDPLSVMQFHDRAFSRNGRATIAPLEPGLLISPSTTLSQLDQMRLQVHFGHECNKRIVSKLLDSCKISLKKQEDLDGNQSVEKESRDYMTVLEYSGENEPEEQNSNNKLDTTEQKDMDSASEEGRVPISIIQKYNATNSSKFEELGVIHMDLEKPGVEKNNSVKRQLPQNADVKDMVSESGEKIVKFGNDESENINIDKDSHSNEPYNRKITIIPLAHSVEDNNEISVSQN